MPLSLKIAHQNGINIVDKQQAGAEGRAIGRRGELGVDTTARGQRGATFN